MSINVEYIKCKVTPIRSVSTHYALVRFIALVIVVAEAGEVSAIPYLRQLLHYNRSWRVRITAVRSLNMLYEKEPAVLKDIASTVNNEHPQVSWEAEEIVKRIQAKK